MLRKKEICQNDTQKFAVKLKDVVRLHKRGQNAGNTRVAEFHYQVFAVKASSTIIM